MTDNVKGSLGVVNGDNGDLTVFKPQGLTIPMGKVKSELPKYWSRDYVNERIGLVKNHRHRMMLTFMWMTGCRITEVCTLRKRDIDFSNFTVQIRWLKSRKYHFRRIPMHPNLKVLLELFVATMKEDDVVFPISRQRAWQLVHKYLDGHPHQLRHSFAVNWLRCGGDITILSRMLGHRQIQTTMEYLKIVPVDQGKELLKVEF